MSESILNPYFELLGIPEGEQPPDRYRLLGIPKFTSNENVIRNAAARHMQFLRRVGGDRFIDQVQEILNEVAEAKLFLLDASKRTGYDVELKTLENLPKPTAAVAEKPANPEEYPQELTAAHFVILSGSQIGVSVPISTPQLLIGFHDDCQVRLEPQEDAIVSQLLVRNNQGRWIIDSPGKVFVLNSRFEEDRAFLNSGDIIRFGPFGPEIQFVQREQRAVELDLFQKQFDQSIEKIERSRPKKDLSQDDTPTNSQFKMHTKGAGAPQKPNASKSAFTAGPPQTKKAAKPKTEPTNTKIRKKKQAPAKKTFQKKKQQSAIIPYLIFGMIALVIILAVVAAILCSKK